MRKWRIDKKGNRFHNTVKLGSATWLGVEIEGERGELGCNNEVGPRVYIDYCDEMRVGDNNLIANDVRIMCRRFRMGSNCKIHNHVFIDGDEVWIGDNVWIGQYSHIDGVGGVEIQDNVTIGYNCYLWTHAQRAGIEPAHEPRPIVLESGVWLMGANVVVNPGVTMAEGSRALSNSVVTKDTLPGRTYGGVPAKEIK